MDPLEDESLLRAKALMITLFNSRKKSVSCEEVIATKSSDEHSKLVDVKIQENNVADSNDPTSRHSETNCDFNENVLIDDLKQKISDVVSEAMNRSFARFKANLGCYPNLEEEYDPNNNGSYKSFTEMGFTFAKQPKSNEKDEANVSCVATKPVQKYKQTLITDFKQYFTSEILNNNNLIVRNDNSYETKSTFVAKKYKCRNITEFFQIKSEAIVTEFESNTTTNEENMSQSIGKESEKAKQPDFPGNGVSEQQDWKWVTPSTETEQDNQLVKLSEEQATPNQITTNDLYQTIQKPRDILKIMTDWNPEWMFRNYTSYDNDSQILTKSQFPLKMLPSQFDSLEENRVSFVPLILHELWSSINRDYEKKSKDEEDIVPGFICRITPYDERFTTFYLLFVLLYLLFVLLRKMET